VPERRLADQLDVRIDQLLRTGGWDPAAGTEDDLEALMRVAEQVLALARRTPPAAPEQKQRLWKRLDGALQRWSSGADPSGWPDSMRTSSTRLLVRLTNSVRGGCRPPQEVVFER
jgi:hypothetical protein